MARKTVITNNKEIYNKLLMLNFSNEVLLKDIKPIQIKRILGTINKNSNVLEMEQVGNYILLRKMNPVNFNIYLK